MIRRALRRPLLTSMTALATTAAVATALAATGNESSQAASPTALTHPTGRSAPEPTLPDPHPLAARQRVQIGAAQHRADLAQAAKARLARLKAERARAAERARVSRAKERTRLLSADPRSAARALLGDFGFGSGQFGCLDSLWQKESGWNYRARNSSSGAFGIPQALPGAKLASAGSDWQTNPVTQIKWGLGYIKSTYGSPCAAWGHSQSSGWY